MLDSRKSKPYGDAKVVSIIGPGTTVNGEVTSEGTVRIEGNLIGRVQCNDSIFVQETGKVKADLIAAQVIISGHVEGNIFAHDRLEIMAQAKVIGDITAPRISIQEGVLFEGRCTMKAPGELKPPVSEKATKEAKPEDAIKSN